MYYEINVSHNGTHFFATAERSLTTEGEMLKAYEIFKETFLAKDGYHILVRKIETHIYNWEI